MDEFVNWLIAQARATDVIKHSTYFIAAGVLFYRENAKMRQVIEKGIETLNGTILDHGRRIQALEDLRKERK